MMKRWPMPSHSLVPSRVLALAAATVTMVAAIFALSTTAASAYSPNDVFVYREYLGKEMPLELVESNVGTGTESEEPPVGPDGAGHTIWFYWAAPAHSRFVVSTCGSDFPTRVDLFKGEIATSLPELSAANATEGDAHLGQECEYVVFPQEEEGFYIRVDGLDRERSTGEVLQGEGDVQLRITPMRPSNDYFADAEELHFQQGSYIGAPELEDVISTGDYGATMEAGEPTDGVEEPTEIGTKVIPGGASIWYTWTSPSDWSPGDWSPNADVWDQGSSVPALYTGNTLTDLRPVPVRWFYAGYEWEYNLVPGERYWLQLYAPVDGQRGGLEESAVKAKVVLQQSSDHQLLIPPPSLMPHETNSSAKPSPQAAPSTPQETRIGARIVKSSAGIATFKFKAGSATRFRCRIDSASWRGCRSPKTYRNLASGRHAFRVTTIGKGGAHGPSPALARFRIAR